ncbi:MAG: histidine kinase [Peptococcaceae bacterium]|nr:histidine kinase [Peptococcaceae bacterium]
MLESKIEELQKKISDLRKRLPAHSVKPGMIEELEELEEELAGLGRKITETVRDKD